MLVLGQTIQTVAAYTLFGLGGIAVTVGVLAALGALAVAVSGRSSATNGISPALRVMIERAEHAGGAFGRGVAWIALLMVLVQFLIVLLRYVFSINSIAVQESVTYMHAALFMLAAGFTLMEDGHVRVDIFYRGFRERTQAAVNFAGAFLFLLPFAALVLWWSLPYVKASWATLEASATPGGLPLVFVMKTIIPAFAVLMVLHGGLMAARAAFTLVGQAPEARDGIR